MESSQHPGYPKTAACACGALTVSVSAPPINVHACACHDCQRRSGSAFTYSAFFPETAVSVTGEFRSWQRIAEAGRFHETSFCPICGCAVFYRLEALPGVVGVSVGSFAESTFDKPAKLYWRVRGHDWLLTPAGVVAVERQ